MTIQKYLLICAGALLIGLSIARGVKADALDWLYAECAPGSELRVMYRREATPARVSRLYVGCHDPDTLVETAYYADLTPAHESQLRTLGSRALSTSRSWSRPALFAVPVFLPAVTRCDRWYLWADDEGARAPAMTRAAKLKVACRG